jgi:DNA-binding NarL/FixJ family response regulator
MVRVLVADDHPVYREGVARAISDRAGLELVGVAADGREAMARIRELTPDVAVLDVRMPGLSGNDVVAEIAREVGRVTRLDRGACREHVRRHFSIDRMADQHERLLAAAAAPAARRRLAPRFLPLEPPIGGLSRRAGSR